MPLTDSHDRSYHQSAAAAGISYPDVSAGYSLLTQTYYDDYGWTSTPGLPASLSTGYTGNSDYFITSTG